MKRLALLVVAIVTYSVIRWGIPAEASGDAAPHAGLTPGEVVELQLAALADNDNPLPNSGIAVVFRFASPSNKQTTGPLDRFTMMVNGDPYRNMLNHQSAELLPAMESPSHTLVPVRLVTEDGANVRYIFVLTRQGSGDCEGCWMTDAVMPVDDETLNGQTPDQELI